MIEEPQPQITEEARYLWETTRGEANNDNEAFGMLLAQIVVELQSVPGDPLPGAVVRRERGHD